MGYERLDEALRQLKTDREREGGVRKTSKPCALIRRPCFKAGLARERKDGASIRGHLVSSQFPWEVKFASDSPVEGDGFELSVPQGQRPAPDHFT